VLRPPAYRADSVMEPSEVQEDILDEIDDGEGRLRQRLEGLIPDLLKRTLVAGIGAVMTTEEGIRKLAKEMSLPKEVASYLASTASTTKDEILRILAREIREFLQNVNLSEEIAKMLTTLSFEVKTEIRFIPNDQKLGGVSPDVKAKVALKSVRRGERRARRRTREPEPEVAGASEPADPSETTE
jgi:hypothetical protein